MILTIKSYTAKKLGHMLGLPVAREVEGAPDFVIRWGNTNYFDGKQLNTAEAITRASHKKLSRDILKEAGLPVPTSNLREFPIIARPIKHTGGRKFFVCNNLMDLANAGARGARYFSNYYPKQNEYRVHVGSGRVLLMSVKEGNKDKLIWNHRVNDFNFRHMHRSEWLNNPHLRNIARASKKAVEVLGLDFGAVDVLADAGHGYPSFVICEVNTAPALSDLALEKYVKYFNEQLNLEHTLI